MPSSFVFDKRKPFERERQRVASIGWRWTFLGSMLGVAGASCHLLKRPLGAASVSAYAVGALQTTCLVGSATMILSGCGTTEAARHMFYENTDKIKLRCGLAVVVVEPPVVNSDGTVTKLARVDVQWSARWPPSWS